MTATDISRYSRGDRDDAAREAGTQARKRWAIDTARNGPAMVDAAQTRHRLLMLHRRMTWIEMADRLPITRRHFFHLMSRRSKRVRRSTAEAVEALWLDVCAPVERDRRRWPTEPLTALAWGDERQRRLIRMGTISTKQAEDYADSLGLLPVEIWADWYTA